MGLAGYPLSGNHQCVCVICMKYRLIILIIIIIRLDEILLSYIENTSRTHACKRAHAHTHAHTPPSLFMLSLFDGPVAPNRDGVSTPFHRFRWRPMAGRCFVQINSRADDSVFAIVVGVFRVGRTVTRTRGTKCF